MKRKRQKTCKDYDMLGGDMAKHKREKGQSINFIVGGWKKLFTDSKVDGEIRANALLWLMWIDKMIDTPPPMPPVRATPAVPKPTIAAIPVEMPAPAQPDSEIGQEPVITDKMLADLRAQFKEGSDATSQEHSADNQPSTDSGLREEVDA
jgi:hypothetical protein